MLVAQIKTDKRIYSLFSDNIESENIEIYGHYFENGKFYQLNDEVFNEFNKLKLGKNYKKIDTTIENNIEYDVILDLDTNLKHYFHNGKEDAQMFFHNFKPFVVALSNNQKDNLKFLAFLLLEVATMQYYLFVAPKFIDLKIAISDSHASVYASTIKKLNETPEFNIDTIKNLINTNPNLREDDKKIILNDDLLNWAIPYINMNKEYKAELYNYILPNFKIEQKGIEEENTIGLRYYDVLVVDVNKINNSSQNKEDYYIDTLIHEFSHLLRPFNTYSLIGEGFTEMINNEFNHLDADPNNSYEQNQKYIKILMEIIGTEPVIIYCFTDNINYIKSELNNYLSEQQLNELIQCFKENDDANSKKIETILNVAFYNKYGIQLNESFLIKKCFLDSNDYNTIRYLNNPTDSIAIRTVCCKEPVFDENNVMIGYEERAYQECISKDILLTCQSLDEAEEKLNHQKTK